MTNEWSEFSPYWKGRASKLEPSLSYHFLKHTRRIRNVVTKFNQREVRRNGNYRLLHLKPDDCSFRVVSFIKAISKTCDWFRSFQAIWLNSRSNNLIVRAVRLLWYGLFLLWKAKLGNFYLKYILWNTLLLIINLIRKNSLL